MIFYRVIWGHHDISISEPIMPHVYEGLGLINEDESIPRICVAPSLDMCISSIGLYTLALNSIRDQVIPKHIIGRYAVGDYVWGHMTFPITVLTFDVPDDPNVIWGPEKVVDYVADAKLMQEHWLMVPTCPTSVSHLWLFDADTKDEYVNIFGKQNKILRVFNTRWVDYERKPNRKFLLEVNRVSCAWDEQRRSNTWF